jgi:hypothetical protein
VRRREHPEGAIHRSVIEHLRVRAAPNCFYFHPANGGYRTAVGAAILKAMGVTSGTPDIILIHGGRVFGLELKTPGRYPTATQIEAMNAMRAAGATVAVAHGIDEATAQLEAWGLLRLNRNDSRNMRTGCPDDQRASAQPTKEEDHAY